MDKVTDLASKKAAVIFTNSSCCMCQVQQFMNFIKIQAGEGRCSPSVPAMFIDGRCVGSAKDVISLHVDESLQQKLIEAGAIWF